MGDWQDIAKIWALEIKILFSFITDVKAKNTIMSLESQTLYRINKICKFYFDNPGKYNMLINDDNNNNFNFTGIQQISFLSIYLSIHY